MIPGLERAEFVRLGQVHRNTFINAPAHLNRFYRLRKRPRIRLAGQITGVEGYLESAATGLAVGLYIAFERRGQPADPLPTTTAFGALARHLVESRPDHFQPANINYGLFPELDTPLPKTQRRAALAARARRTRTPGQLTEPITEQDENGRSPHPLRPRRARPRG